MRENAPAKHLSLAGMVRRDALIALDIAKFELKTGLMRLHGLGFRYGPGDNRGRFA